MNEQLVADLKAAKALIKTPEKWCKDTLRIGDGRGGFCAWCSIGAIYQVTSNASIHRHIDATSVLSRVVGYGVAEWNDAPERTHAEVMEAFDKAIEAASRS